MGDGEEEYESELGRLSSVHMPPLTGRVPLLASETEIFARGRRLIMEGLSDGGAYTYDAVRQTLFIPTRDPVE